MTDPEHREPEGHSSDLPQLMRHRDRLTGPALGGAALLLSAV